MPEDQKSPKEYWIVPLYGGEPYYSPDDVTQELPSGQPDTREMPVFQSLHLRRKNFWEKWRLWLIGTAMVLGLTAGVSAAVAGLHQCCAAGSPVIPAAPPAAPRPAVISVPTATEHPTTTRSTTP